MSHLRPQPVRLELNDLFASAGIDPAKVIVVRHRPQQPALRRIFPWLVVERPELFNLYQAVQSGHVGRAFAGAGFVAAFVGMAAGEATFAGLYSVHGARPLSAAEFWALPGQAELGQLGLKGVEADIDPLWIDLRLEAGWEDWIGLLTVNWPGRELSWWRRAERNAFAVRSILEASRFEAEMPAWDELVLSWNELRLLPQSWKRRLAEWRGIYFIHDRQRGIGYVGSAYGQDNLLGRWTEYAASGHGGNVDLRKSRPEDLVFSILQRTSPDLSANEVIEIEHRWMLRLHTRTHGMNAGGG